MMHIYIDESGSINSLEKGFFSVALLFIKDNDNYKYKNEFKNSVSYFKYKYSLPNEEEIKGYNLNKEHLLPQGLQLLDDIKKNVHTVISYLDNKNLKGRPLRNKAAYFNQLVARGISLAIDKGIISEDDILFIHCDDRNLPKNSLNSLLDHLDTLFIERSIDIKIKKIEYLDSYINWGIQAADLSSYFSYRHLVGDKYNLSPSAQRHFVENYRIRNYPTKMSPNQKMYLKS